MKQYGIYAAIGLLTLSLILSIVLFFYFKNDTIAIVGDENITKEEFYDYMKIKHGKEVLDDMVLQASLYEGKEIPFNNVLSGLNELEKGKLDSTKFNELVLNETGQYETRVFEENVKEQLQMNDEDIKVEFEKEKVLVDVTYVRISDGTKANKAFEMIKNGKSLTEVNQEYLKEEIGQNIATTGLVKVEELNTKIYQYVKDLNAGEVSELIKDNGYYYIVELTQKQEKTFEEFKMEYMNKKAQELNVDLENKVLPDLLKEVEIKEPYFN